MKSPDESDVGIVCYISQLPGFRGILKQRYSDFIVNEVDLSDNVVHLTSLEAPLELGDEEKAVNLSELPNNSYDAEVEEFRALVGDHDAEKLRALINGITSSATEFDKEIDPIELSPSSDKAHRTLVHNFFKEKLKFIVTDTVDGPDASSKRIRVRSNNQGKKGSKKRKIHDRSYDRRGSDNWPESRGRFLRFNLYKENKDTQEALRIIGKMLGIQSRSFGFSGTKDKRAITTQRVTVFKQKASKLAALNNRLIGIKIGNFCYVNEGLVLGQLHGNRFTVTLRGVVAESEDNIIASANVLGKQGFINYFGLQRFGSGSIPTYLIGANLLRGEWKNAVDLILDPREGEKDDIKKIRDYYKETNDINGTLRKLPHYLVAESAILNCLRKCPGNYLQALKAIPRTLRMMYVHSYQSYLWNHAVSTRIQKYGVNELVLGDLVYCKEQQAVEIEDVTCNDSSGTDHLDGIIDGGDLPIETTIKSVKAITKEDIVSGTYKVDDIVLPLPGSRVIYPKNDISKVYNDLANKDSISLTESAHSVKEFSITEMTGGYRQVFQKPKDFTWKIHSYTDMNVALAETDIDMIDKSRITRIRDNDEEQLVASQNEEDKLSGGNGEESKEPCDGPENDTQRIQKALQLSFTLPASAYATMAIRELLKTSTSVAFHKTLNS